MEIKSAKPSCCKCGSELLPVHWTRSNSCPDGFMSYHCINTDCKAFNIQLLERDFHERTSEYIDMVLEERAAWVEWRITRPGIAITERVLKSRAALQEYYIYRRKHSQLSSPISELV